MQRALKPLTKVTKCPGSTLTHLQAPQGSTRTQPQRLVRGYLTVSPRRLAQPVLELPSSNMITQPIPPPLLSQHRTKTNRHALPASWMRCGTSKGLFIDRQYLPQSTSSWQPWLMAAMGSKGGDLRQLDGIGGATSTTSKVAIVTPSAKPGVDVEYTFAQVAVGKEVVDYTGNCGNIASGVGPFAIEQGMVDAPYGKKQVDVRILNTNTNKFLVETVALDEYGCYEESGSYRIAGVAGTGSEVKVAFLNPAGTMTGRLFPTGNRQDIIKLPKRSSDTARQVQATLIDAGNPFVLVDASSLAIPLEKSALLQPDTLLLRELNDIRCQAAVMMGLAPDVKQARLTPGTPKIAMVMPSSEVTRLFLERAEDNSEPDIFVISLSMGKLHPSLQLTGAVAIASALSVEDTIPYQLSRRATHDDTSFNVYGRQTRSDLCIAHPSGNINVSVEAHSTPAEAHIDACSISRTARTLFEGQVLFRS